MPGETWDFSEQNVKNVCSTTYSIYSEGFDREHDGAGSNFIVIAYLARWSGPIRESDDPYNANNGYSPMNKPIQKQIFDVDILPARADAADNDNIKYAIFYNGGVNSSYYVDPNSINGNIHYNPTTHAYYYNISTTNNHSITLVGWDDNFPASRFNITPPGPGAFIVKNSWGTGWGENGYFYISYYDAVLAMPSYRTSQFRFAAPTTMFGTVYQYDPFGWVHRYGYGNNVAWGANIFTAIATDTIIAVSTFALTDSTKYQIYVYTNATSGPRSGTLSSSTSGTMPIAGYHTIFLNTPVTVTNGMKFSVVIRYNTPRLNHPIPIEDPLPGYCSKPSAHAGESFASSDGSSWTEDIGQTYNANVCIKAFTKFPVPPTGIDDTWQFYH